MSLEQSHSLPQVSTKHVSQNVVHKRRQAGSPGYQREEPCLRRKHTKENKDIGNVSSPVYFTTDALPAPSSPARSKNKKIQKYEKQKARYPRKCSKPSWVVFT